MMDIAILCITALLATMLSWLYLSNRTPSLSDFGENTAEELEQLLQETADAEEVADTALPKSGIKIKKPIGKQWLFLVMMLFGLCAMAVSLELIYEKNTLVDNLKLIALLAILFTAAKVDAKEQIIPNVLVLTGLILRVVFWIVELIVEPDAFLNVIKDNLLACLLVVVFVVVGVFLIKGGLGMGDIKLMLVMCLFQGFYGVVSALFSALFVAFIYAIVVLIAKKKKRKDSVAFAPAILLGTMISVFLTGM